MFSRDDLGSLFNDKGDDSRSGLFQSTSATSKSVGSLKSNDNSHRSIPSSSSSSSKPIRYWPGQKPQQYMHNNDDDEEEEGEIHSSSHNHPSSKELLSTVDPALPSSIIIPGTNYEITVPSTSIASIPYNTIHNNINTTEPDIPRPSNQPRRREYFVAEVVSTTNTNTTTVPSTSVPMGTEPSTQPQTNEEPEEDIAARRARIRERLKARNQETEQPNQSSNDTVPSRQPIEATTIEPSIPSINNNQTTISESKPTRRPIEAAVISSTAEVLPILPPAVHPPATQIVSPPKSSAQEEEESSDEEEDDELSNTANTAWNYGRPLFRPVFRGKQERHTLIEAENKAKEEQAALEAQAKLNEQRVIESKEKVVKALQAEEAIATADREAEDERNRPNDTDKPEDEDKDFEEWRLRELQRIKRDMDEEAKIAMEVAETERRRKLTPEERAREDKELEAQGLKIFHKEKSNNQHRGAFFTEETSTLLSHRPSTSTEEKPTSIDRSSFPAAMQVKNFGRRGQIRWTTLAKEDTTSHDAYYRDGSRILPDAAKQRLETFRGGNKDF